MTDPNGTVHPPEGEQRWEKWERWREGELQLPGVPDPAHGLGEPDRPTQVPWRAREGFGIFFLHLIGAALIALFVAVFVSTRDELTAVTILLTEMSLIATTLIWIKVRYGLGPRALGFRALTAANVFIGLGIGLLGLVVSLAIGAALQQTIESVTNEPAPEPNQIPLDQDPSGWLLWVIGISVVLLAPIAEEAFFRGFVFGGLRRWARPGPAILISSIAFTIPHVEPIVLLPIFVLGIVLAWVVERRRSLVPAIVAHLAFNLFGFIALFLV